jgi:hypothetical protein
MCILEFDGDLTDWLVRDGIAKPFGPWACFHTSMFAMDLEGVACGIIARTIGGPYAVLIAEQLQAAGAKLIIGLTSAGCVSPDLPPQSYCKYNPNNEMRWLGRGVETYDLRLSWTTRSRNSTSTESAASSTGRRNTI